MQREFVEYKTSMTTYCEPQRFFSDKKGLEFSHALPVVGVRLWRELSKAEGPNENLDQSLQSTDPPWR